MNFIEYIEKYIEYIKEYVKKMNNNKEKIEFNIEKINPKENSIKKEIFINTEIEDLKSEENIKKELYYINVEMRTNVGLYRKNNEDNFYLDCGVINEKYLEEFSCKYKSNLNDKAIFAVCDGMGGEAMGEVASFIAVSTLKEYREKFNLVLSSQEEKDIINSYVTEANNRICDMLRSEKASNGGTTYAMLFFDKNIVYPCNLGDSRIYLYDNNKLKLLSTDHTVAAQKVKNNIYTEEEARNSIDGHKLTYYLGIDKEKMGLNAIYGETVKIKDNYKFLICSDGLTDMCTDLEIENILKKYNENFAEHLVDLALKNGGKDNITCIVLEIKRYF